MKKKEEENKRLEEVWIKFINDPKIQDEFGWDEWFKRHQDDYKFFATSSEQTDLE